MPIIIEQTSYEPIPAGNYPTKITNLEEDNKYENNPQLRFTFELPPNEEGKTRTIFGWVNMKFSPKSTLYVWTQAAFGGEPIDRSYSFNSDDLLGKKVYISVTVEKKDDGRVSNKVKIVSPFTEEAHKHSLPPDDVGDW